MSDRTRGVIIRNLRAQLPGVINIDQDEKYSFHLLSFFGWFHLSQS